MLELTHILNLYLKVFFMTLEYNICIFQNF